VDADESPYDAAVRELKEELGILVAPGRLLVVDWVPPRPGRTEGVMFVFDGGVLDPARGSEIHLPVEELRSWASSTPDEADSRLSELLARRVRAARRARDHVLGERQPGGLSWEHEERALGGAGQGSPGESGGLVELGP
jgi:8-oxo-dGTP diphosphatase